MREKVFELHQVDMGGQHFQAHSGKKLIEHRDDWTAVKSRYERQLVIVALILHGS